MAGGKVRGFYTKDDKVKPITSRQSSITEFTSSVENAARVKLLKQIAGKKAPEALVIQPEIVSSGSIIEAITAPGPVAFKTYAQGGQSWEVAESEYVARQIEKKKASLANNIKYYKDELAKLGPRAEAKRQQYQMFIGLWSKDLKKLEENDSLLTDRLRQEAHDHYVQLVKDAIRTGKAVPDDVVRQYPEFRVAKDARRRYEKGLHTSFANKSAAVNAVMQQELGYKVKRQDGTPIPEAQISEIAQGIRDVTAVLGNLKDIMLKEDLTIAHTNGKYPFLNGGASGLYHPNERTITTGLAVGPIKMKSLAHELAHALDYAGGRKNDRGYEIYYPRGSYRARQVKSDKVAVSNDDESILMDAAMKINGSSWSIKRAMDISEEMTQEQKDTARYLKAKLGTYWNDPREVFARLVEQYVAVEAGKATVAADAPEDYYKMPGYWKKEVFDEFKPKVKAEIEKRLLLARGQ